MWLALIGPNQIQGHLPEPASLFVLYLQLSQRTKLFLWETFKHFLLPNPPSLILTDLT